MLICMRFYSLSFHIHNHSLLNLYHANEYQLLCLFCACSLWPYLYFISSFFVSCVSCHFLYTFSTSYCSYFIAFCNDSHLYNLKFILQLQSFLLYISLQHRITDSLLFSVILIIFLKSLNKQNGTSCVNLWLWWHNLTINFYHIQSRFM